VEVARSAAGVRADCSRDKKGREQNMFGTMLVDVGILVLVSGLISTYLHRIKARHARLALDLPQALAVRDGTEQPSRVSGCIVAPDDGCLVAPCSGASVVWFCIRVHRNVGRGGKGSLWATLAEEVDSKSVYLEDGSGSRIRVALAGAAVYVDAKGFDTSSPELVERVNAFLNQRGILSLDGDREEQCLVPGDSVNAVGLLRREGGELRPTARTAVMRPPASWSSEGRRGWN
jgi:hypothetical protein